MTAIPIDIPLPLPAPEGVLKLLLVITFITHILFVGLMVGGAYWSVIFKLLAKLPGGENPFYDRLAKETLSTVTVNKSLAVVLAVAPLLLIGLAYTRYWYTANMITVKAFLSIIWLVMLAFWLLYAYKYSWDKLADRPEIHLPLGIAACAIFSFVPLIFLANINLMLLPFEWGSTHGFLQALLLPNVIPRYLHFIVAVCAMIGFFAAIYYWYMGRKSEDPFYERAQRIGLKWALSGTLLQGIFGGLVFLTLPDGAYSNILLIHLAIATALAAAVCIVLIRALQQTSGRLIIAACVLLAVVALLMSTIRHIVRENLLREPHRIAEQRTREYRAEFAAFLETYSPDVEKALTGEKLFKQYCSSCHARDRQLVGPSLEYITGKYEDKQENMIDYALDPVKVNPDLPRMPKPMIERAEVERIAEYILMEGAEEIEESKAAKAKPDGEPLFKRYCSVCHAPDRRLVGPPVNYMIEKYGGKQEQMIGFVLNPVKVNPDYPKMPKHPLTEEQITSIVEFVFGGSEKEAEKPTQPAEPKAKPHGEALFKRYCSMCHARDRQLVGPPVTYMIGKYDGAEEEMLEFILNPTQQDPDLPRMPKPSADKDAIEQIVGYILAEED